jgi:hypothetical protein
MSRQILQTEQKALEINLDPTIYGTFAEIGAGQEVARNFFQVGAAAGTIAKTMSAYDKSFSDAIYGEEVKRRYVCRSRICKMLDHEYKLIDDRLTEQNADKRFFVFADTVSAINYTKTIKGNGWLGLRFQLTTEGPTNDLILHAKMLDNDNQLQQEAIGVLGVNMLYACFFHHDNIEDFVISLLDGLKDRMKIDMISLNGPDFDHLDSRLLSLYLVKHRLTEVSIFDEQGKSIHASEFLYKKDLMVVRGHYQPPTKVTLDVFRSGFEQFCKEPEVNKENARLITELTLHNLDKDEDFDIDDYLSRVKLLNALGHKVIISNCDNHQKLINYLSDYKIKMLGLVIGLLELKAIIEEKYFNNLDGSLLVSFGELFNKNINVYVYPVLTEDNKLITAKTLMVPEGIHFLYKHLIDSKQIVEIDNYTKQNLGIFPFKVFELIKQNKPGWEKALPEELVSLIKTERLFGYSEEVNYEV